MSSPLALRISGTAALLAFGLLGATTRALPQEPVVFRTGADLVTLDVRVLDRAGQPIADLRPEEVQIVDGGVRRPILLLRHVGEAGRSYQESAMRTIASEVSTNQGAPRGQLYVLIFDQHHITPGAEMRVRAAAERFLRQRVKPEDRVAIYGLPGPGPALPLTAGTAAAIAQLPSIRGALERMVTGTIGDMTIHEAFEIIRGNDAVLSRFLIASPADGNGTSTRTSALVDMVASAKGALDPATIKRLVTENAQLIVDRADGEARRFLQLSATLLRSLRGIDGRKTVLLFSEGFNDDNVTRDIQDVAAAAAETYSVIYAFDLNQRFNSVGDEARGNDTAREIANVTAPLGSLAAETSGTLIIDAANRLDQAIGSVGNPDGDYYVIGFEPAAGAPSGGSVYRRVGVQVTREGARVVTRTGYSPGRASTPLERRQAIDAALTSPFGQQGLKVEYTTYVSHSDVAGQERVALSLESDLPLASEGQTTADVVFVVRESRTGQVVASGTDRMALPERTTPRAATGRGTWHVQFTLPPGNYLMRCVVREPGGLIGSADRRFNVRAMSGPGVAPSDLILGGAAASLPLRARGFTGAPLAGALRVYGRSPDQLAAISATLALVSTADGSTAATASGLVDPVQDRGGSPSRDVTFQVPLSRVAPGEYVAQVSLKSGGELIADLRRQVVVESGMPLAAETDRTGALSARASAPRDVVESAIAQSVIARARTRADAAGNFATRGITLLGGEHYAEAAEALTASFDARQDAGVAFLLGWARRGANSQAPPARLGARPFWMRR